MVDVSSSLGEDRVLWGGCMKRRVPQNTLGRKIDNFCPTYAWTPSDHDTVCVSVIIKKLCSKLRVCFIHTA